MALIAFGFLAVKSLMPVTVVEETATVESLDYRFYALEIKWDERVSVRFSVMGNGDITFFICEEAEFDLWKKGENVSFGVYYPKTQGTTVVWVCSATGTYHFVFDNTHSSAAKTVEVTITLQ